MRRKLRGTFLSTTRYSRIHDFDVFFSLRIGQQTYCGDYETVVLDEINDLASSQGKDVEITLNQSKRRVTLYMPQNRRLKARIVSASHCLAPVDKDVRCGDAKMRQDIKIGRAEPDHTGSA